ncbi:hypothetical protein [Hymenobacter properus]|uniref:Uncharacterized protein n=1 Tax=Hymenobacter properus TaxID=2791026 RepID=A0A931BE29_9BACT|nr:hypothetical protein [Hymenobacter properus]MBF9140856.1 hypothetical protein [Hymenobacter properus]MBR7719665.1 hypothetical protein [Microvirga sp. SRT04]
MRTKQELMERIERLQGQNETLAAEAKAHYETPYHLQTPEQRQWDGDANVRQSRANQSEINALRWVLQTAI